MAHRSLYISDVLVDFSKSGKNVESAELRIGELHTPVERAARKTLRQTFSPPMNISLGVSFSLHLQHKRLFGMKTEDEDIDFDTDDIFRVSDARGKPERQEYIKFHKKIKIVVELFGSITTELRKCVAITIGLAAGSLGTETDGSIVDPSSRNNVVGIKPTIGLVSRPGVIPISSHQDTAGPMCRSVTDVTLLLNTIAGPDPQDEATLHQPRVIPNYMRALDKNSLKGARLGVPRSFICDVNTIEETFNSSLDIFRALGAEILVGTVDFKIDVNKYISELVEVPTGVKALTDLIEFNKTCADQELPAPFYTDQSQFIKSEAAQVDDAYFAALAKDFDLGCMRGIDTTLAQFNLDAIILPTDALAPLPAAIAGYPLISVPLGFQPDDIEVLPETPSPLHTQALGLPFGISFVGTVYSKFKLIGYVYVFEQATHARLVLHMCISRNFLTLSSHKWLCNMLANLG
ncbi:amidase signature domain-containing protein [Suillus subluteus]|nr:amidase signature domain-containing protein [Suillus subluteus]